MIDPGTELLELPATTGGKHRKIKAAVRAYQRWAGGRDPWIAIPLIVLIPAAYLASFAFLTGLALRVGWPWWLAWTLPLVVDATVTAAWRIYLVQNRDDFALYVAAAATAASVAGNAALHLYSTGHGSPGTVVVTLVGAVPALGVGFVVVMEARRRGTDQRPARKAAALERIQVLAGEIRDRHLADLSGDKLAAELKVSKTVALEARRVAREPVSA